MSGAAVVHKQNEYIRLFKEAEAFDAEHSVSIRELGIRKSVVFNLMAARGIFIKVTEERYYLCKEALWQFKRKRRKKKYFVAVLVTVIVLTAVLINME